MCNNVLPPAGSFSVNFDCMGDQIESEYDIAVESTMNGYLDLESGVSDTNQLSQIKFLTVSY